MSQLSASPVALQSPVEVILPLSYEALLAGCKDGTIYVVSVAQLQNAAAAKTQVQAQAMPNSQLESKNQPVSAICKITGNRFAVGYNGGAVLAWTGRGAVNQRMIAHTDRVSGLALLSNGLLASGSKDKSIRVWDSKGGVQLDCRTDAHSGPITSLASVGDWIVSGSSEDTHVITWGWDEEKSQVRASMVDASPLLPAPVSLASAVLPCRFSSVAPFRPASVASPDPALPPPSPLSSSLLQLVSLVDASLGNDPPTPVHSLLWLTGSIVAIGSDHTVIFLDVKAQSVLDGEINSVQGEVWCLALLPNGMIAAGSGERQVTVWSQASLRPPIGPLAFPLHHTSDVRGLAVCGSSLISLGSDGMLCVWDVSSAKVCNSFA